MKQPILSLFISKKTKALLSLFFLFAIVLPTDLLGQQVSNYQTSWIGNTYGGADQKWVQNYIRCMEVAADGTCYTESEWDEAGRTHGVYKDGDVIGNEPGRNLNCGSAGGWSIDGNKIVGNGKTITNAGNPTAIAMGRGAYSGRLLVADNGARKQVLVYNVAGTPYIEFSLGVEGGIGADMTATYTLPATDNSPEYPAGNYAPGVFHPLKLWGLSGVGMDDEGRIFVSTDEMGSMIRSFRETDGKWVLDWLVMNMMFVDNVDYDAKSDATHVYGVQEHFVLDYAKQTPGSEWELFGYSLDSYQYPNDPRGIEDVHAGHEHGITATTYREVDGHRLLFTMGMTCQMLNIFRYQDNSEIAVPAGLIMRRNHRIYDLPLTYFWPPNRPSIASGTMIWRDANGDGNYQGNEYSMTNVDYSGTYWVDSQGNIWLGAGESIAVRVLSGFDAHGNPIYNDADAVNHSIKGLNGSIGKIIYQEDKDRVVLLTKGSCRTLTNSSIYTISNWSEGNRSAQYVGETKGPEASSFSAAGDYYFDGGLKTRGEIWVSSILNGNQVGTLLPGPEVGGVNQTGWIDIGYGVNAYQRPNGEYLVFVEDDGWGKVLMYRWCPSGSCSETSVPTPQACFTTDKTTGNAPLTVSFNASCSNNSSNYTWNFGDGSTASGKTATHTFTQTGNYSVKLTVQGNAGSDTETKTVSVTASEGELLTSVMNSSDDAEQLLDGTVDLVSDDLDFRSTNLSGLRFALDVPPSSTIDEAHISFTAKGAGSGDNTLLFKAQASDNAATFSTTNQNITARSTLSSSVSWNPGSWTDGQTYTSPDLSALVQSVVNRPGYKAGNHIVITVTSNANNANKRAARSYDYNSNSNQTPQLVVSYQEASKGDDCEASPVVLDDTNSQVSYSGNWGAQQFSGRYQNTLHETNQVGAYFEVSFCGSQIALLAEKQGWGGEASVSIDGQAAGTVSFKGSESLKSIVYSQSGLSSGKHTLRVTNTSGGWIYCDAVLLNGANARQTLAGKTSIQGLDAPASDLVRVYPNPATGSVRFSQSVDVRLFNSQGQEVLSRRGIEQLDISALPSGLYVARFDNGQTTKLVLE